MDTPKNFKRIRFVFSECEHHGDLDNYTADITNSGGKVIKSEIIEDNEEGWVLFEVDDKNIFMNKFKTTHAYNFKL